MKKYKFKKTKLTFLLVVVLQIFLLVNLTPSNSYLLDKLSITQVGSVSAEEVWGCCPLTIEGAICQDTPLVSGDACVEEIVPTKCDRHSDCKVGCCVDEEEGLCTTKAPKGKCESDEGIWENEENCLISECQRGCCVLGSDVEFVTPTRCKKLSLMYGSPEDFRDLKTEYECLALAANQAKGACIFEGGLCKFQTESECLQKEGSFSEDSLCSKPSLNTDCEKQATISCLQGEDEIYWFDSCGNQENIYSSDRDASWNNGIALSKEESCNSDSANIDSESCGNCNYFLGSKCFEKKEGVIDGNFVCESLNCVDENGKPRKNGESWCVYDSYIGDGKDAVGSRHWKRMCIEGEVKVEPCRDYRGQICVQAEIGENSSNDKFSTAACTMNEAMICIGYNFQGDKEKSCRENKDCIIKNVNIDTHFKFDTCVGRHPKGFDLTDSEDDASSEVCSLATNKCTVTYVKNWKGDWKCEDNCDCERKEFTEKMNDYCVSLGDCGTYVNYIGKGTDNIKVSGAPGISWSEYKSYAKPKEGQFAEPKDLRQILGTISGNVGTPWEQGDAGLGAVQMIGTVVGGAGTLLTAGTWVTGTTIFYASGYTGGIAGTGFFAGSSSAGVGAGVTPVLGAFASAAAGIGIGMMVGGYLAKWRGMTGAGATMMTIAGGVAGAAVVVLYGGVAKFGATLVAIAPYALIIAVIVMIYLMIVGVGKVKTIEVKFDCMPWKAPLGGDDCEECNKDSLKPCSEYKCSSLGQACKLLNENTENPICESVPNDGAAPIISPGEIEEGYKFSEQQDKRVIVRKTNNDCIEEFTPVWFILETDEHSQCKFDFQKTSNYESMGSYPLELNSFSKNHSFAFSMPSMDSLGFSIKQLGLGGFKGNLTEVFENMNMYVRCQDYHGNFNNDEYMVNFCVNSGPDITPARVIVTEPKNNAYLSYGETQMPLDIYLNEPAECKYDNQDMIYESMRNEMTCLTELSDILDNGWKCSTTLTELSTNNNFYIRCKDQPWFTNDTMVEYNNETNETIIKTRNINTESFVYTLQSSPSELKIASISPQGEIKEGFEPISVDLEVKTSGGINNGEATCSYSFSDQMIPFFDTYSSYHKQNFNTMMKGNYNIKVKCEDEAGNTDSGNASFSLKIDSSASVVTRVYQQDGSLILMTNEDSKCYYDSIDCSFDIDDATPMTTVFSKQHSADIVTGKVYYVKCLDIWGNPPNGCTIKVLAGA